MTTDPKATSNTEWAPPPWTPPGKRVRFYRLTAGKSQEWLGAQMMPPRTQGWVSQVEKGVLPLNRLSQIDQIASILGVSRELLTGDPQPPRTSGDLDAAISVQSIRAALLVPDQVGEPRALVRLEDMADLAMRARMHCDHASLGALLPLLLADARTMCERPATRVDGLRLMVKAAVTGALAVKPLGYVDLALLLAERAEQAAQDLDDPTFRAAAQFVMAQCVMAHGNANRQSLTIASRGADQVAAAGAGNDARAWRVMLLLHSGLAAAMLHDDDRSQEYLDAAAGLVGEVEGDPWRMEANPANVDLWRLSASVSNGHPERAPQLARQVDRSLLRTPQRLARLHLDHAAGLALQEESPDFHGATVQLLEAERIAPDDVHRRPSVKELVRAIVMNTPPRARHEKLAALALNVGLGPEES